jgi:hypothetical protein
MTLFILMVDGEMDLDFYFCGCCEITCLDAGGEPGSSADNIPPGGTLSGNLQVLYCTVL